MRRSWGILGINVDITRMIINNISGLPRVSPTKWWWCSGGLIIKIYSYFTIIWISTLYKDLWKELARSPQKDSQNISARSPSRNSQDFATRILQRNSQVSNLSTQEPTRARYKDPSKTPVRPPLSDPFQELTLSFCKDLTGIQFFTRIYPTITVIYR
jgi:hypothetical protein